MTTTTTISPKEAALNVWKAFGSRDAAQIRAAFTPDGKWIAPPGNATAIAAGADATSVASVDGIIAFITGEAYAKLFRDVKVDFLSAIAEGDTVVMENIFRAKLPNGRDYANRYCWVFKVHGGKVAEMREYMDTHGGFAQIFGEETPRKLV